MSRDADRRSAAAAQRGLSLIETVVALGLFGVVAVALGMMYAFYSTSQESRDLDRFALQASNCAEVLIGVWESQERGVVELADDWDDEGPDWCDGGFASFDDEFSDCFPNFETGENWFNEACVCDPDDPPDEDEGCLNDQFYQEDDSGHRTIWLQVHDADIYLEVRIYSRFEPEGGSFDPDDPPEVSPVYLYLPLDD